jgi:hypothetical protein
MSGSNGVVFSVAKGREGPQHRPPKDNPVNPRALPAGGRPTMGKGAGGRARSLRAPRPGVSLRVGCGCCVGRGRSDSLVSVASRMAEAGTASGASWPRRWSWVWPRLRGSGSVPCPGTPRALLFTCRIWLGARGVAGAGTLWGGGAVGRWCPRRHGPPPRGNEAVRFVPGPGGIVRWALAAGEVLVLDLVCTRVSIERCVHVLSVLELVPIRLGLWWGRMGAPTGVGAPVPICPVGCAWRFYATGL